MPNPERNPNEIGLSGADRFAFGDFVLDLSRGALRHGDNEIRLRTKSLDVLTYLVRNPGRLIPKAELIEAVWPEVAVTDDSLVQCLVEIRRALGGGREWIHTARGRGYRFDGDVQPGRTSAQPPAPLLDASPSRQTANHPEVMWRPVAGLTAAVLVGLVAWLVWSSRPHVAPRPVDAARVFGEGERTQDQRNRQSLGRELEADERAIALDPNFAPAYAGLANALVVSGVFGGARPGDAYPRAKAAALRAVALDPMLADGHVALGHVRVQWDRDWSGAEASYRRALALDPDNARGHMLYGLLLGVLGRQDEAIRESQNAARLLPSSATMSAGLAIALFGAHRTADAIEEARRAIDLDPAFSLGHFWLALALADAGRFDDAMSSALASRAGAGNLPAPVVGYIHGRAGRRAEALEVLHALEAARAQSIYVPATDLALVAIGIGDHAAALTWLERAFDERAHWMDILRIFQPFDPLREEPRFKALVARMQFP